MYGTYHTRTVIPYAYGIQNCTIRVWYGTHQLQLKRNTRVTRKSHTCYTRVFLPAYTQLHAIEFIFVYRLTRVTITCLHAKPPGPLSVTKTGPPDHFYPDRFLRDSTRVYKYRDAWPKRYWHCNLQYAFEEQLRQYYLRTP